MKDHNNKNRRPDITVYVARLHDLWSLWNRCVAQESDVAIYATQDGWNVGWSVGRISLMIFPLTRGAKTRIDRIGRRSVGRILLMFPLIRRAKTTKNRSNTQEKRGGKHENL